MILDKDTENEIMNIFIKLAHEDNKCVIIVTHSENVCKRCEEVYELKKIYNSTDEYNNKYNLYYHKTSCGRYYCKESSIQMFPRELRKDILSNYTEIDMNSSIFSLYINLAKMYDYTGNI